MPENVSSAGYAGGRVPESILDRYEEFRGAASERIGSGLINQTFLAVSADGRSRAVFQRLHGIFSPAVNEDIAAVTEHLAEKGIPTPRILRTAGGGLFAEDGNGGIWRALTFIEGRSLDRLESPEQACAAGALTARFHAAMSDFKRPFVHVRPGVHDIKKHLETLQRALEDHRDHRLYGRAAPLAAEIFRAAEEIPDFSGLPDRVIHGDLKISNLMFDAEGRGLCLIDLDTMARQKWIFEMGDALRSWCNRRGEDTDRAGIDTGFFAAAVSGYFGALRGTGFPESAEAEALVFGLAYICLELTSRFLADALNESYFGFDPSRFPARGEHNLLRASGQWALRADVLRKAAELEAITARAR